MKCRQWFLRKAGLFFRRIQTTSKFCLQHSLKLTKQCCFPETLSLNNVLQMKNGNLLTETMIEKTEKVVLKTNRVSVNAIYTNMHVLTIPFRETKRNNGQSMGVPQVKKCSSRHYLKNSTWKFWIGLGWNLEKSFSTSTFLLNRTITIPT